MFNRKYIFQWTIFHCYVSLPEGTSHEKKHPPPNSPQFKTGCQPLGRFQPIVFFPPQARHLKNQAQDMVDEVPTKRRHVFFRLVFQIQIEEEHNTEVLRLDFQCETWDKRYQKDSKIVIIQNLKKHECPIYHLKIHKIHV